MYQPLHLELARARQSERLPREPRAGYRRAARLIQLEVRRRRRHER